MSKINDGGPAYPGREYNGYSNGGHHYKPVAGMSLRDWFAGLAMQGSRARHSTYKSWDDLATDAYEMADAMLAARTKGGDADG